MATPLPLDPLARVRSLLERGRAVLNTSQFRRLQVIEHLGSGNGTAQVETARALGLSPQVVNHIVKRLRDPHRIADDIVACEARLLEIAKKQDQLPRKRGPRGNTTWEDFETTLGITDKTVIELASIIVSSVARVAVLAVYAPAAVHETIEEFSSYGWDDARWSNVSAFDWLAAKSMGYLREGVQSMDPGEDEVKTSISPVGDRFGQECTFYILEDKQLDGAVEARWALFPSGDGFHEVSRPYEGGFFDHLEQLLCRIRERHSCIGFLPGLRKLYEAARRWDEYGYESAFHWHTDQDDPGGWRAKRTTARVYLAQSGCLYELSPTLWSQLPYAKQAKFRTLKSRPKVSVADYDAAAGTVTLLVEPVPECGYFVTINSCDDPEKVTQRHRELLRGDSPTGRFIYSAWADDQSLTRPPFLLERSHLKSSGSEICATGIVLIPRHFLLPEPQVDLDRVVAWAGSPGIGPLTISAQEAGTDSDLQIMVMPEIMQGIKQAFRANRYGDAHRELWRHQERLRLAQAEYRGVIDPQRQVNLLGMDPLSGPYYYFTASELVSKTPTAQVHERFAHRLFTLRAEERGELANENPFWSGDSSRYNDHRTLLTLLLDFDADFLLLGLSAGSYAAVAASTEKWGERIRDVILRKVQCEAQAGLNADLLWRVIRRKPEATDDRIMDCFTSTLPIFCECYARRARRQAVENAQRLVLSRHKPEGVLVESEEAIFRNWRSYFGQRARGVLTEVAVEDQQRQQHYSEMVDSNRTTVSKNRQRLHNEFSDDTAGWDDGESVDEW